MRRTLRILVVVASLIFYTSTAFAASPWKEEGGYWDQVQAKFLFGMANFYGGWVDLINEPVTHVEDGKNVFIGLGKGFVHSIAMTFGGILHTVTGPLTFIDIPLPHNGVDL